MGNNQLCLRNIMSRIFFSVNSISLKILNHWSRKCNKIFKLIVVVHYITLFSVCNYSCSTMMLSDSDYLTHCGKYFRTLHTYTQMCSLKNRRINSLLCNIIHDLKNITRYKTNEMFSETIYDLCFLITDTFYFENYWQI